MGKQERAMKMDLCMREIFIKIAGMVRVEFNMEMDRSTKEASKII